MLFVRVAVARTRKNEGKIYEVASARTRKNKGKLRKGKKGKKDKRNIFEKKKKDNNVF
jgi:hypothetical protein